MTNNSYIGSSLDELLEEDGILAEVSAVALKRVLAWQVLQEMKNRGLSKSQMAVAMRTSRPSLDRLLDPNNSSVTLKTMERAATVLGKRLRIEIVDAQGPEASSASQRLANSTSPKLLKGNASSSLSNKDLRRNGAKDLNMLQSATLSAKATKPLASSTCG
jgi:antitoxin HicB